LDISKNLDCKSKEQTANIWHEKVLVLDLQSSLSKKNRSMQKNVLNDPWSLIAAWKFDPIKNVSSVKFQTHTFYYTIEGRKFNYWKKFCKLTNSRWHVSLPLSC